MTWITKILSAILLVLFLGTMFFSLFHVSSGMEMSGTMGMSDCPFMSHEEVLCSMNFTDHISAWKTAFLSITPTLTILLLAAGTIALIASIAPNLLLKPRYAIPILRKHIQERTYTFSYRPLQELFSNGILHPKLF
ncbi:hypothetical protein N8083_02290 [Candidatus Pacebacteria bacterium]|nr:hypothetical protein [Candidatus Paceibacterota bacterium]